MAYDTGDGTRYARVVTEEVMVEQQQYEHSATPIASSADEYKAYVRETYLAARFEAASLPSEQREILDRIVAGGGRYNEHKPLSEALKALIDRLGLVDVDMPDEGSVVFSEPSYFRYRGSFYSAELQIFH